MRGPSFTLPFQKILERAKGFEPSTPTLARSCSTTELHPHPRDWRRRSADNGQSYAKCGPLMQQGRNAAESAVIRPKQAVARKPALNGGGLRGNRAAAGQPAPAMAGGSPRLKIAFPAPFKAVLEPAQHIEARIT
jgi:hypothetical protein